MSVHITALCRDSRVSNSQEHTSSKHHDNCQEDQEAKTTIKMNKRKCRLNLLMMLLCVRKDLELI